MIDDHQRDRRSKKVSHRAKAVISKALMETPVPDRWMAEISYLDGRPQQTITFEELEDLDEIVERGPDWNMIDKIVITLNRPCPSCWERFKE